MMHMKKVMIIAALFTVVLFIAGCAPETPVQQTTTPVPSTPQQPVLPVVDSAPEPASEPADGAPEPSDPEPTAQPSTPQVKEFSLTAKRWSFTPNTVTVNQGDTVKFSITSVDVTHGFTISEFGVSERLIPGRTTEVEFVADQKGSFTFFCTVFCGSGHGGMRGTLVVQ